MTSPARYTHRLHAFVPSKVWTIEDGGIGWTDLDEDGLGGFIPTSNITSVRLRFEPTRAQRQRVGLHIYTPIDHHITNVNYQGVMDFDHQPEAFRAFVLAFHDLFEPDSPIAFHSGSTPQAYWGNIAITTGLVLCLLCLAPIFSLTGIPGITIIIRLGIIAYFLPSLVKLIKRNKPARYAPDDVPMQMLGL